MENFVEITTNLQAEIMICGRNVPDDYVLFIQASAMLMLDSDRCICKLFCVLEEILARPCSCEVTLNCPYDILSFVC